MKPCVEVVAMQAAAARHGIRISTADTWLTDEKHGSKHDPFRIALNDWGHAPRGILPLGSAGLPPSCGVDGDERREDYRCERVDEEGLKEWRKSKEHQNLRALRRGGSWTGDLRVGRGVMGRSGQRITLFGRLASWGIVRDGIVVNVCVLFGFIAFLFTFLVAFLFGRSFL
jgi:hypothetical protein